MEQKEPLLQESSLQNKKKPAGNYVSVRQDRVSVSSGNYSIQYGGSFSKVINYGPFGLAVEGIVLNFEAPTQVEFFLDDIKITDLYLLKVRSDVIKNANHVTAFEIVGDKLDVGRVMAVARSHDIIRKHRRILWAAKKIPDVFRGKVYEFKEWLQNLEAEVNSLKVYEPTTGKKAIDEFEKSVCEVVSQYLSQSVPAMCDEIMWTTSSLSPSQLMSSMDFFREKLSDILFQAPFAERSFKKPRGFPGDYEIMNLIYRDEPAGKTLFAKCLHRYFIDQPAAKAVRNRVEYMLTKLQDAIKTSEAEEGVKILSIASGPARELEEFIKKTDFDNSPKVDIVLLDQDLESLQYAQRQLKSLNWEKAKKVKVSYANTALKNVMMRGIGEDRFHLIYALGIFDYLTDLSAKAVAKKIFRALRKGGTLIIGNFDIQNPSRHTMRLALDWDLKYRSESDLRRLYSELSQDLVIEREPSGVNLFCVIRK